MRIPSQTWAVCPDLLRDFYLNLLRHSYQVEKETCGVPPDGPLEYLADSVFDFVTYDSEKSEILGRKAVEVCLAINEGSTVDYIGDPDNYIWYLLMVNMPFFKDKIDWGTSIRGAFWRCDGLIELDTLGLWDDYKQLQGPFQFDVDHWKAFIQSVADFCGIASGAR